MESVTLLDLSAPTQADGPEKESHLGHVIPSWSVGAQSSQGITGDTQPAPAWQNAWKFLLKSPGQNSPQENVLLNSMCCLS